MRRNDLLLACSLTKCQQHQGWDESGLLRSLDSSVSHGAGIQLFEFYGIGSGGAGTSAPLNGLPGLQQRPRGAVGGSCDVLLAVP